MSKRNLAWHFVGQLLHDESPVPADGVWLEHNGPLKMCKSGLHFSRQPFDALRYALGETLCLVEIGGKIVEHTDKGVCSRRKIIARMDATELLRYFARMRALSVIHPWDAPDVVLDYLMTGDASLRSAAHSVASSAYLAKAHSAPLAVYAMAAYSAVSAASYWVNSSTARSAARLEFNSLVYECFEDFLLEAKR